MKWPGGRLLVLGVAAVAVVIGGGAAVAAGTSGSSSPSSFLDSVARHLGISSKKLEDAVQAAEIDRIDQALKDGRITKAQADELKARIEKGGGLFLGPRLFAPGLLPVPAFRHHFGFRDHLELGLGIYAFGKLSAAADYLGLTQAQLRQKLASGQTLAEIAKAQGKSVDGLENALLDAVKKKVDKAVDKGLLTRAEADDLLKGLETRIHALVNGRLPGRLGMRKLWLHPGFGFAPGVRPFDHRPPAFPSWGTST
jgi:ribosomal protein S20